MFVLSNRDVLVEGRSYLYSLTFQTWPVERIDRIGEFCNHLIRYLDHPISDFNARELAFCVVPVTQEVRRTINNFSGANHNVLILLRNHTRSVGF